MKRTILCASFLAAACGLANVNIVNPSYSLRDVQPRVNLGMPPSIDFQFVVGVDNPNSVALRLDHLDFDLLIDNDVVLNNVRSDQGIHIPARGFGEVNLTTHVTYNNIQSIYDHIVDVVQGNRANYTIRGNAYYDTPVGTLRFPITVNFR